MSRPIINGASVTTFAALAVTAVLTASVIPPVFQAATAEAPDAADPAGTFEQLADDHAEQLVTDRRRFDGRSVFFAPIRLDWMGAKPAPKPPPPAPVVERDPEPRDPVPPPEPVKRVVVYNGPPVKGIDGQSVYFDKADMRIRVGETNEDIGVTVLSLEDAPWSVKIEYEGEEFDLPLFARASDERIFAGATSIEGATGNTPSRIQPADSPGRNVARPASRRGNSRGGRDRDN